MALSLRACVCCARRGFLHRSHNLIFANLSRRLEHSAAAAGSNDDDDDGEELPQRKIPMVPKRRDPNAVLKALSSTVKPLKHRLQEGGRSLADPLSPNFRDQHMLYLRAKEAGKKAARYVIHRWPQMFPQRISQPGLAPLKIKVKGCNEITLKHLIATRKTGRAMKMYRLLQEKGEVVSVETQNELLSLLAHYGLGNPWMIGKTRLPHRKGTSPREGPSPQEGTSSREGTSPREGPSPREGTSHREGPSPRDAQEDQPREEEQLDTKSDSDSESSDDESDDESGDESSSDAEGQVGEATEMTAGEATEMAAGEATEMAAGEATGMTAGEATDMTAATEMTAATDMTAGEATDMTAATEMTARTKTKPSPLTEKSETRRVWSLDNHAEKFFAEMKEKNGGTYDALIPGLVKFGNYKRAFEMFERMRKEGHQATLPTYNALLVAIVNFQNVPQQWKKAKDIVIQMSEEPIVKPNITTINLLLRITHRAGTSSKQFAVETMREMAHLGIEPNLTTFLSLLGAYTMHTEGSILYEITEYLEENQHINTFQDRNDVQFFPAAIHIARLLQDPELAVRLKRMAMKDDWLMVPHLRYFLNHYFVTLAYTAEVATLKQEYRSLVPLEVAPSEWVYGALLRACENKHAPEFALELWSDVRKHIREPNTETMERFCGALSGRIDLIEVDRYVAVLVRELKRHDKLNIKPPPLLLSQIVRLYTLIDELDKAWEYYWSFGKYSIQPTFLALSSLLKGHIGYRDPEKIVSILEIMIEKRMYLPATYIRDICWTAGVNADKKNVLLERFAENATKREVEPNKGWSGRQTAFRRGRGERNTENP